MCFHSNWSFVNPPLPLPSSRASSGTDRIQRFLLLFALANAGGVIAYAPLLTLLLPAKIAALAGDARIEWLGAATLVGAIAASLGNLAFGWASDLVGSRRNWASAGLILTVASYVLLQQASSQGEIIGAVVVYQLALNMLLAPLFAWAADVVPDERKGLLGGLLAAGQPIGALAGVVATLPILSSGTLPLLVVCIMVVAATAPLLLWAASVPKVEARPTVSKRTNSRRDFILIWAARLLMQVAGNVMFAFLLFYFLSLPEALSQSGVARLSAVSLVIAFPIALAAGRLSDRLGPRKPFLIAAAMTAASGLGIMAAEKGMAFAVAGFFLFSCAASVFNSLHTGYSMQLLPSPGRRGRDMGVLNLTNTLPAILAPVLAMLLVPGRGFGLLLIVLMVLVVLSGLCVLLVRHDTQRGGLPQAAVAA